MVAQRFNGGFPEGSADGKVIANEKHLLHPNIQQLHETVNHSVHGSFSLEESHRFGKIFKLFMTRS
jgi:hypothetical protein